MSWGGFGHGILGALGKVGGGITRGLHAGSEEPIFKDPTREALLRLLIGGEKPGPAWQGPEMPHGLQANRDYDAFIEQLTAPKVTPVAAKPIAASHEHAALETLPPLDDETLIARDLR